MTGSLADQIVELVAAETGLTDRQIADRLRGTDAAVQPINAACRRLAAQGVLARTPRADGKFGNHVAKSLRVAPAAGAVPPLCEDWLKAALQAWLCAGGWDAKIAWGKAKGIDIAARRGGQRWVIEVKGKGTLPAMYVNFFLAVLGETLQRMDDPHTRYSIALPDVPQFRKLWQKSPAAAKARTQITALFVDGAGNVTQR